MLTKTTLWSCLMVTLPARVIHLFMNWCFVSSKITLCSCLMVTFSASTSCTLWIHELIFVLSKMTCWSCLIVTLGARFLQPFICCFFVSSKTTLLSCLMVTLCFFVLSKTIVPDSSSFLCFFLKLSNYIHVFQIPTVIFMHHNCSCPAPKPFSVLMWYTLAYPARPCISV